ncbi:MAG TPA: OB-fold domain-containing protein [Trebonia sp.]
MTQVPIADGLLTALDGEPRMLASRCPRCDARSYPVQSGCARCGSVDLAVMELSPHGTVWTWTSQEFRPKSPPYAGPETAETFTPYLVGFVEVVEGLCVEARLVGFDGRRPRIGEDVTLVVVPFRVDEQGNEVVVPAFEPAAASGEQGGTDA